jgi:glycosyltransferase involved in cell wall biosynthesis
VFGRTRRLVIGLEAIDESWMGGAIYVRNVLRCLSSLTKKERPLVRLLHADPSSEIAIEAQCLGTDGNRSLTGLPARVSRMLTRGPQGNEERLDVIYPAFSGAPVNAAPMYWIPDFQHIHLPHFFEKSEIEARTESIRAIAVRRGVLILSSKEALGDFLRLHPDAVVTPRVWSFCSVLKETERAGKDPRPVHGLPEKYLYIPNQFWAHKNHSTAFEALSLLKKEGVHVQVVCTGRTDDRRDDAFFPSLLDFLCRNDLSGQVRLLGVLPRNEQIQVLRYCAAVLQPSLFEGWSTVVEDAKAVGRPLILSDLAVHKEQTEGLQDVWFFDRSSAGDLARALKSAWPSLSPGPDAHEEKKAGEVAQQRCRVLARQFIEIAAEAVMLHKKVARTGATENNDAE